MNQLLKRALKAVEELPPEQQDEIARAMLSMAETGPAREMIDPDHLSDVLAGLAQADRDEFATEAEVEAAFRRFDG